MPGPRSEDKSSVNVKRERDGGGRECCWCSGAAKAEVRTMSSELGSSTLPC